MPRDRGPMDVQVPFFVPLWRRIAVVAVLGVWTLVELASGAHLWAAGFGAATAYLVHQFFIAWTGPSGD